MFSKTLLKNKLIIITEITDSALMAIANKYDAEIIEHKEFIGGRYSVLSESGMFPVALMGLNLMKFKNLNILHIEGLLASLPENIDELKNLQFISISMHSHKLL